MLHYGAQIARMYIPFVLLNTAEFMFNDLDLANSLVLAFLHNVLANSHLLLQLNLNT